MSELRRPRTGRVIGGVCAALARRFGWDVTLVRVVTIVSLLLPGPQLIIYVIAWIVIWALFGTSRGLVEQARGKDWLSAFPGLATYPPQMFEAPPAK